MPCSFFRDTKLFVLAASYSAAVEVVFAFFSGMTLVLEVTAPCSAENTRERNEAVRNDVSARGSAENTRERNARGFVVRAARATFILRRLVGCSGVKSAWCALSA